MINVKLIIVSIFLLLITGCGITQPQIGQKAFPKEDDFIIKALVYENNGDLAKAEGIYNFLYKKTDKKVYYEKYIEMLFFQKKYNKVIQKADKFLQKTWDDEVFKYEIFALLEKKELNKAKEKLLKEFNKKNEFYYSMMSYILTKQKKYDEALVYSRSLYALNPSKQNLLNLADLLIKNKRYNEALAYLQTHYKLYGCDYEICLRIAQIYQALYDTENLAVIYEKLGKYDSKFYILALNLYVDNGKYKKAVDLINRHNLNREYLIYVYEQMKDYKKAALVAMDLYLKTKNIDYLLKYTIDIYNASQDRETVNEVVDKLKYILTKRKSAFLYNFLGYILIDKNINPKEGLKYVQKALMLSPDNEEYMDSLAWGYYKIKKCKEAWEIIKNIESNDTTILMHKKKIKRCLNDFEKNNRAYKKRSSKKKKRK